MRKCKNFITNIYKKPKVSIRLLANRRIHKHIFKYKKNKKIDTQVC